jgi:hypothetical protein
VNGFASVVAAVLATVLAIHWGFSAVVFLAATLYLLAAVTFPGDQPNHHPESLQAMEAYAGNNRSWSISPRKPGRSTTGSGSRHRNPS